jgi:hypothetical protein
VTAKSRKWALVVLLWVGLGAKETQAMLYHPGQGSMWDPSVLWYDGNYHAFMMYSRDTGNGLKAGHCIKAISPDGVHWRTDAVVIEEPERAKGWKFFKCFVGRCGDRFIMNHGIARPEGQDMLRFYESTDLRNWKLLFSSRPDPRWYGLPPEKHRWDHMYILPKEEGNPKAGYWGHPVSAPKPFDKGGVGMMQSPDGMNWEVLPPAPIEYPAGVKVLNYLEWGGCERFGGKYYLIGGTGAYLGSKGYGMYWFVADAPTGPFRMDPDAPRLCGNSHVDLSWLATWCRAKDELLVSNYASPVPRNLSPWMLPLRKPMLDEKGRLRLGWWKGNEALKGEVIPLDKTSVSLTAAGGITSLDANILFNEDRGVVVEGRIRVTAKGAAPGAGPAFYEPQGKTMVMLLGIGAPGTRETQTGRVAADGTFALMDCVGQYSACVTGIEDGKEHSFRLLSRIGLFELYVDDLLVQTFYYEKGAGRLGFAARAAEAHIEGLRAWHMSL